MECLSISVKGIVQGVGFRPFIYNLARDLSLRGFVTNTSEGVLIILEGNNLEVFIEKMRTGSPPLAKIMSIDISPELCRGFSDFAIKESIESGSFTLVSPDVSVCDDCLAEMNDINDRRYRYPFINCTNCGPRFSITRSVPYDRPNTTMNAFRMCGDCDAEYRNPANRRFHAQPNACSRCGPQVSLVVGDESSCFSGDPLLKTIGLLKEGKVIAVKGLGGFHIACDASNNVAVKRLRKLKRKNNKPFALMAPDIASIRKFCHVSAEEEILLASPRRPIVLLAKRAGHSLPETVSPANRHLAFMLPYTPLHYLLFVRDGKSLPAAETEEPEFHFDALVMTSGNLSEEPVVIDNSEAFSKLGSLVDAFLIHDRDIFSRVDDSVVRAGKRKNPGTLRGKTFDDAGLYFIRRSRGFVPDPIPLDGDGPDVLGCGADVKNTFTITKGRYAIPSQHIGDMENYETLRFFEESLANLMSVYRAHPEAIAYDLHPGYLSHQWALRQEMTCDGRPVTRHGVQHHYAHVASVMAEKGITGKVIGVAFDGSGYGNDGTLWGGEFLVADVTGFNRAGHIAYVPLPGGEMAVREPWRMALSYLRNAAGNEVYDYARSAGLMEKYGKSGVETILKISGQKSFSPLSSGAGRVFDAVSALLGVCDRNTFEGEAAIALESLLLDRIPEDYPVNVIFSDPFQIDFSITFLSILEDMRKGVDKRVISTKFHNSVISSIAKVVPGVSRTHNVRTVVLSGGVFQNLYLLNKVTDVLRAQDMDVHTNNLVPCNDAGISLGQAYIIRERIKSGGGEA